MSFKIKMNGDFVAVKPDEPKAFRESGVIIPEQSRKFEDSHTGVVLAVGPGQIGAPIENVKPGDTVLFNTSGGRWVENFGPEKWFQVRHCDIVAIDPVKNV